MKKKISSSNAVKAYRLARRALYDPKYPKLQQYLHDPELKKEMKKSVKNYLRARSMSFPVRFLRHFKTVVVHKSWVCWYCLRAGILYRGIMHDWSKFSPTEFLGSVRYYNGKESPIGMERILTGYSAAWLHHRGRNRHHYQYWHDVIDEHGNRCKVRNMIIPIQVPFTFALEMICDTIGASRAYNGREFSYDVLLNWWRAKNPSALTIHPQTHRFSQLMYEELQRAGNCGALRRARAIYEQAEREIQAERLQEQKQNQNQ